MSKSTTRNNTAKAQWLEAISSSMFRLTIAQHENDRGRIGFPTKQIATYMLENNLVPEYAGKALGKIRSQISIYITQNYHNIGDHSLFRPMRSFGDGSWILNSALVKANDLGMPEQPQHVVKHVPSVAERNNALEEAQKMIAVGKFITDPCTYIELLT